MNPFYFSESAYSSKREPSILRVIEELNGNNHGGQEINKTDCNYSGVNIMEHVISS